MGGGGGEGWGGEGVSKYKKHQCYPMLQCREFFQTQEFLLLMTIADSPLLGQSANGLNFCDDSRRSPLADSLR
jgi:hypothetical protein